MYDLKRGLGRDLAKLGDKLHQLEKAMGEFSLQQVRGASSHNSNEKSKHGLKFKVSVKTKVKVVR